MRVGISVAPSNSLEQLRKTLPQAGYGQGYVATSPLRMARVAAAIASNGVFRELRTDGHSPRSSEEAEYAPLLSPQAASLLGQYLRDAVLDGTGRSLRNHPLKIAGKTGTAEIKGARSHAWFVGFALSGSRESLSSSSKMPYGDGRCSCAGEIVTAVASLGLIN
jgi:peptidoglycan glycosyltransferase